MEEVVEVKEKERLDKFISNLVSISRSLAQDYILKGFVKVNGTIVDKPSKILKPGDKLILNFQPIINTNLRDYKFEKYSITPENVKIYSQMNIPVLYEDQNFLCISKPVMNVNQVGTSPSIFEYLIYKGINPFLVHRLDKQTTGCLLIAKNYQTATKISKLFSNRKIKKKYIAIVQGKLEKNLTIQAPIYHTKNPLKKEIVSFGKEALTIVNVKKIFNYLDFSSFVKIDENLIKSILTEGILKKIQDFSLLEIEILTGRTHQIRVHLSSLEHPVVGDTKYGSSIHLPFFLLHSYYTAFNLDQKKYEFKCFPDWLPDELKLIFN
ncbi:MAG: RluA family pseudouridine synthase [bacterium]